MSGAFVVCMDCKIGLHTPIEDNLDEAATSEEARGWSKSHLGHSIEMVPAPQYLSEYLRNGFIVENHPDLEPITTSFGDNTKSTSPKPFGDPGIEKTLATQRQARRDVILATNVEKRPLLKKESTEPGAIFEESFWKWFSRLDIGVPRRFLTIEARNLEGKSVSDVEFGDGHYTVLFDPEALPPNNPQLVERFALCELIKVSGMQRFADNSADAFNWVAEQYAITLLSQEKGLTQNRR